MINLLRPKNVHFPKKRIGPPEDGGYVMPEIVLERCSAVFTYGVGNEIRYEKEFSETYHKPAYLFDHTVDLPSKLGDNLHFFKEGLGTGDNCKDFTEHYSSLNIEGPVFLKIDIEGGEYDYFLNANVEEISNKTLGLSLEVHWIDDSRNREKFIKMMDRITPYYTLCHIHGNNWGELWEYQGCQIPKVLELSFINKSLVIVEEDDLQSYPIEGLDMPNNPNKPDYKLAFINSDKIILTLTSIPSRLSYENEEGIKKCISSLLDQSYDNYEIHFNIPEINNYTGEKYEIPEWLLQNDKIKIFRVEDLGPVTKLYYTVERIKDPNTIIIVVDDDLVYDKDMIKAHIENREKYPEFPVGYDGLRSRDSEGRFSGYFGDSRDYYYSAHHRDSRVDILQHYKSVSYRRRFFEDDFFDFVKSNMSWNDDLLIAAYFSFKKRDRISTYHSSDAEFKTFDDWLKYGGVTTFPVIEHTSHASQEGCNVYRQNQIDDNSLNLYKFVDNGYRI